MTLSQRLDHIGQQHLVIGLHRWRAILVECTAEDSGIQLALAQQGCVTIFDTPAEGWAKAEHTSWPWYDREGQLVVSEATANRIEERIEQL